MKAVIETTPQNRDRIKKLADDHDLPIKQVTTAILNLVLPQFESGQAELVTPSARFIKGSKEDSE